MIEYGLPSQRVTTCQFATTVTKQCNFVPA